MKNRLKNWVVGICALGCLLSWIACDSKPGGQSPMKSKTPDFGAISSVDGGGEEEPKKAEAPALQPADAPAAGGSVSKGAADVSASQAGAAASPQK